MHQLHRSSPMRRSQEQLYLAQSKEPDSPFFNDGVAIEIQGPYDKHLLEDATRRIVRRHEALRCVLVNAGGADKVQQRVLPLTRSLWESIWNYQLVHADHLEMASADLFSVPLDLFSGPLVKIHLLEAENPEEAPEARISVLIVQAHHICWDSFSDGVFLEELRTLYQDPVAAFKTPAPSMATVDSQPRPGDASITELNDYLRNVPESVDLPTDLAPPQKKSYSRGGVLRFQLAATLIRQAIASAGRNITPTSLLLTLYAAVLRRFAGGQSDFALGIPMANRVTAESAGSIGFFVNMLPLRVQADEEHRLFDLLDMVEAGLGTLCRNQDVLLANVYHRQQSSSYTHDRLLKFCFSFQDAPEGKLGDTCTFRRWPLYNGAARADLTCFTELCVDGSVSGELEYDADLFDRETIASISDCMSYVLQRVASHQAWESTLGELTLAETQARDLPVMGDESFKRPEDLGAYFLRVVDAYGQKVAIVDEASKCCITYDELSQRARYLAHQIYLTASQPGAVLLLLQRSWELPVSQIASALAGRPWICCDVSQPRERVMRIVDDANSGCIITQRGIATNLPPLSSYGVPIIYPVEHFNSAWDAACDIPQTSREANLAYVIYTSGTTGMPKGVAIEQQSLIQFLDHIRSWTARPRGPTAFNSILTSNTAFDGSFSQMYSALTTGGRLIIAEHGGEQDGEYVAATLSKYDVNYLCTTTAAMRLWMSQSSQSHPEFFGPHFRCLLLGGDELAPAFVSTIFARSSCPESVEVKNVYGPTEGTIFSSYGNYKVSDLNWLVSRRRSPIDTMLPSAAISIVGPDLRDLPGGAVGEIVIWGSCLAREYLNLPELNAAKFITRDKLRGWRTGDHGRRTGLSGGGAFEVLGRADSMRKVLGGFRVDLNEAGLALASHAKVRECHVSTVDEDDGEDAKETKMVAHVVLHQQQRKQEDLDTVSNWRAMFTGVNQSLEEYDNEGIDLGFDYRGWASSFDRSTIPKEDMEEWVSCTVKRILDLDCFRGGMKPLVAEIGCGTGMILFRLADKFSSYYGTDLAESTVAQVQRHSRTMGYDHIRIETLPAHEFDILLPEGERFDLIICNSVAQYFPSLEYLDEVLRRARNRQAPCGVLFMGDVRHEGLKTHHAVTSAFSRGARTVAALQASTAEILDKDKELQINPSVFVDRVWCS